MKPVEIHVKNFLSYKEERLTLAEHANVVCVTGFNGDGKSSLVVDAILCALFAEGRGEAKLDTMIRDGEKEAMVSFTFEVNGKRYRVKRIIHKTTSRNQRLFEEWNGHAWTNAVTSDVEVKASIYRLLPYSYTTFIHTAFVLQGQTDRFLSRKSADERQETLREVLALSGYEERAEVASELRRKAEREASVRVSQADQLKNDAALRRGQAETQIRTFRALQVELTPKEQSLRNARELATLRVGTLEAARAQYRLAIDSLREARRGWRENVGRRDAGLERVQVLKQLSERRQEFAVAAELYQFGTAAVARWEEVRRRRDDLVREIELLRTRSKVEEQSVAHQLKEAEGVQATLQAATGRAVSATQRMADLKVLVADWTTLTELENRQKQLSPSIAELRKNIEHIETDDGPCPFCLQEMQGASREQALDRLRQRLTEMRTVDEAIGRNLNALKARVQETMTTLNLKERRHVDIALNEAENDVAAGDQALLQKPKADQTVEELRKRAGAVKTELASVLAPLENELAGLTYDPTAHQAARNQIEENRVSYEEYLRLDGELAELPVLEERVKGLDELVSSEARKRLSAARQALDQRKAAMGYDRAMAQKTRSENEHKSVLDELQKAASEVSAANTLLDGCEKDEARAIDLSNEGYRLERRARLLSVLEQAYRPEGVPALIIREAMPSLLQKANALLDRWTSGRIVIDERPQEGVMGKRPRGNLSDLQFDIWDMDADCARPYVLYSGGERFRVDMALRIALSQLLAERAGSPVQMLVIDEGFGTQDPDGLQKMIQIIHDLRRDFHSIIVISHIEEIKRMGYDRMIRIVKQDGISRIEEGA